MVQLNFLLEITHSITYLKMKNSWSSLWRSLEVTIFLNYRYWLFFFSDLSFSLLSSQIDFPCQVHHVSFELCLCSQVIPLDISEEIQRQILSELSILFQCNSQHIIGFHGAFFMENKISMCTEYMDGGSLDFYGKIPQNVLGRIAVAVCIHWMKFFFVSDRLIVLSIW